MSVTKQEVQALIEELQQYLNDVEEERYNEEFLSIAEEEGWYQWHEELVTAEAEPVIDNIPF